MSARDYTDSEPESDSGTPSRPAVSHAAHDGGRSGASTPAPASPRHADVSPSKASGGGAGGNRSLKITLRPSLGHLVNDSGASPSSSTVDHDLDAELDRDSLSPPPPIKLKLGMKHSLGANAAYSSSDDSDTAPSKKDPHRSPPAKKQRTKKQPKERTNSATSGPSLPAQHRKQYDWLQPSSASASHHGPPERERATSHVSTTADSDAGDDGRAGSSNWGGGSDDGMSATGTPGGTPSDKPKKSRKKDSGPGKNWRKGMRKGDPMPWKDGAAFLADGRKARSSPLATPLRGATASAEATPEPLDAAILAAAGMGGTATRESSPPFVLADAVKLGFPVFSKPIVTPKLNLGPFPKVTSFFAPFDNKPFKKETVRSWSNTEPRVIHGVGGGTLKFKTWQKGPTSDLGRVIAAQKEADQLAAKRKKEMKDSKEASETPNPERPPFTHSASTDSLPGVGGSDDSKPDADEGSEIGDEEGTPARDTSASPAPARGRKRAPKKPRKSKLAQEIILTEEGDEESLVDAAKEEIAALI